MRIYTINQDSLTETQDVLQGRDWTDVILKHSELISHVNQSWKYFPFIYNFDKYYYGCLNTPLQVENVIKNLESCLKKDINNNIIRWRHGRIVILYILFLIFHNIFIWILFFRIFICCFIISFKSLKLESYHLSTKSAKVIFI